MIAMMISSMTWAASSSVSGEDSVEGWKAKLNTWSTSALPTTTFPELEDGEIQTAAEILSEDLSDLQSLSGSTVAAFSENVASALFEVACLKEEETSLSFDVREALVKIAEKRTLNLHFEYWADILAYASKEEDELIYSAKAAKNGHEESLQFLRAEVRDGNERARELMKEYDLANADDDEGDDE